LLLAFDGRYLFQEVHILAIGNQPELSAGGSQHDFSRLDPDTGNSGV
jgi:hypothetical protein